MPAKRKGRPEGPAVKVAGPKRKPIYFSQQQYYGASVGGRKGQLSLESLVVITIVILVSAGGYSFFSAINRNLDGRKGLFLAMSQAEGAAIILGEAANFGVPFEIKTNLTQGVDRVFGNRLFVRVDGVEGSAPVVGMPDALVNKAGEFWSYER